MSILTGWREQYDRMKRSHTRLLSVTDGSTAIASDDARDTLIHFYQDAYHLKDWIIEDSTLGLPRQAVEAAIDASRPLTICADVCNGVKHFRLRRPRRAGAKAQIVSQSVTIGLPTARWPEPDEPEAGSIAHVWEIEYDGRTHDAAELATDIVAAWDSWLAKGKLLPAGSQP